MSQFTPEEDGLREENDALAFKLQLLGKDVSAFDDLMPHERNVRLKRTLEHVEDTNEAALRGQEPPPTYLDPTSSDWIPDVEDLVHFTSENLLGQNCQVWPDAALSDEELERELGRLLDLLAQKGIAFAINETVPDRLAYRYLLEELDEGLDVMPVMTTVIDGCSGACEECFQLPYCESGQELAAEYGFEVPAPPLPPKVVFPFGLG